MVINLLVVSAERVAPIPETKPNVSVNPEALKEVPSTVMDLHILAEVVMVVPEIPIPLPPVSVTSPVDPSKDTTPLLVMVEPDTPTPDPAAREIMPELVKVPLERE